MNRRDFETIRGLLGHADFAARAQDPVAAELVAEFERLFREPDSEGFRRLTRHGDFPRFFEIVAALPVSESESRLDERAPRAALSPLAAREALERLRGLEPWRKGPFRLESEELDAEWRCDMKWRRLEELASNFRGRRVLDVGSGNGYYLLRLEGAGAALAVGIEPSVLYTAQFLALSKLLAPRSITFLPIALEDLTQPTKAFDTVLSMGVLYHRRDPREHLRDLGQQLRPGGELVLETLVLDRPGEEALTPTDRYAMMRNVFYLPSPALLRRWLLEAGYDDLKFGEAVRTTSEEQRQSEFMNGPSLADFLDPSNPDLTIEGYPAPTRMMVRARLSR